MFDDELLRAGVTIDGRFTLVRPLGRGGMGAVWLAQDAGQGSSLVALKVLHPRFSQSPTAVERMSREAEVLARLDHPNIARPVAFTAGANITYLAMEFVDGQPLHEMIAARGGQQLPLVDVARIFEELCMGVAYAHHSGVVHRDLKPQNVMIQSRPGEPSVKILDFGVAKMMEGDSGDGTTQGRTIGSLFYLSPEQTRGDPADRASDVFALGSMLFELLTSRRMWAKDRAGAQLPAFTVPILADGVNSITQVVERIVRGARPKPSDYRAELPAELDRVIARAVSVDPLERHPSADALREEAMACLVPADRAELTMVQPRGVGESEEEITTAGGGSSGSPRLPSILEAKSVHVPTRAIEGGVSKFLDVEQSETAIKASTASTDKSSPAEDSQGERPAEPTQLLDPRPKLPAPVTMASPPSSGTLRGGPFGSLATPDEVSIRAQHQRAPWTLVVFGLAASVVLVLTTYLITRASYENAQAPVASAPPPPPPVTAAPEPVAIRASEAPVATEPPAPVETERPAPTPTPTAAARRRSTEAPAPASKKPAPRAGQLSQLLSAAREAPEDTARLVALSSAIARAADKVPDPEARTSIRRVAASSAMVRDLSGLEDAYQELARALERAGESVP